MKDKIELTTAKLPDQVDAIGCVVCSHVSERPLVVAQGETEGRSVIICPHCLCNDGIDAKLDRHATDLDARARWLRTLIGRLKLPSPAVLKEFASPQETERVATFWGELGQLLELDLPIDQAAPRAGRLRRNPGDCGR